jgi:uncharacterized membrane protein
MRHDFSRNSNRATLLLNQSAMASVAFNRWLLLFFSYSFFGWVIETCFILFFRHQFIVRGWLEFGFPVIPLYGICGLFLIKLLSPLKKKPLLVFLAAAGITGVVEYLIGLVLINVFGLKLWDYSRMPFSINGIIALPITLGWGIIALIVIYWANPKLIKMISKIKPVPAALMCWIMIIYSSFCGGTDIGRVIFIAFFQNRQPLP